MTAVSRPTGRLARTARLMSLPLAFGGRAVAGLGRTLAGADRAEVSADTTARNAEQLFAVLGTLKGGAIKIGQALSVFDTMVPAEIAEPYHDALSRLQSSGPAMPKRDVHEMLARQLGSGWPRRFREFDDEPSAAASIGQVHQAIWADRRAVAVKIQYPGADLALDADLRTLARFASLFALVVPGLDVRAVVAELRARMLDELDYRTEADRQPFGAAFAGSDRLVVPRVVASAPKVLVSEWVDGVTLGALTRRPAADAEEQARRDRLAHTVVEALFSSPARVELLHADPHPGNFMTLADGRLAMIDYGAVAALPGGVPPVLTRILRHVADGEPEPMMRLLRAEGFVAGDVTPEEVLVYLGGVGDPLRVARFHFTRAWTRGQGARIVRDSATRRTGRGLTLPARHLLVVRVLSGWMNILAQIDCAVAVRDLAEQWLPGFADAVPAMERHCDPRRRAESPDSPC